MASENMTDDEQIKYAELLGEKNSLFKRNKVAIYYKDKNPNPLIPSMAYIEGFKDICEFIHKIDAINWLNGDIK